MLRFLKLNNVFGILSTLFSIKTVLNAKFIEEKLMKVI